MLKQIIWLTLDVDTDSYIGFRLSLQMNEQKKKVNIHSIFID